MATLNIDIARIPLGRAAKYGYIDVDTTRFTETVHQHVYMYGLRQILNDAIADKTNDDGEALATEALYNKADRRLATLYSGELRVRRESAEPSDPVERIAARMAWERITETVRKFPEYAKTKGKDRIMATLAVRAKARGKADPDRDTLIAQTLAAHPEITREAQRRVKEDAKGAGDLGIDI